MTGRKKETDKQEVDRHAERGQQKEADSIFQRETKCEKENREGVRNSNAQSSLERGFGRACGYACGRG